MSSGACAATGAARYPGLLSKELRNRFAQEDEPGGEGGESGAAAGGSTTAISIDALPANILRGCILPRNNDGRQAPLLPMAQAWHALGLTCRAWAAALQGQPLAVEACIPLPPLLPWLRSHCTALRLVPPPSALLRIGASEDLGYEWVQAHCGPLNHDGLGLGGSMTNPQASVACCPATLATLPPACRRQAALPCMPDRPHMHTRACRLQHRLSTSSTCTASPPLAGGAAPTGSCTSCLWSAGRP